MSGNQNSKTQRPRYVSYLPPAYLDGPDGFLSRFIALFESMMSGGEKTLFRQLESWVSMDELHSVLTSEVSPEGDLRYDSETRRLIAVGPMSEAERDRLKALMSPPPVSATEEEKEAYKSYNEGLDLLHTRSLGRQERLAGVEEILDHIELYSDAFTAPSSAVSTDAEGLFDQGFFDDDFLSYLAGWVALTLKPRWSEAKKRRLIRNIVPLYKKRGTLEGITKFLEIFVESQVNVHEELGLQVGVRSTIDVDTRVGGLPHFFTVEIPYGFRDAGVTEPRPFDFKFLQNTTTNTKEILDLEKPAHTDYRALYRFPGIIVADYSTVGKDTLVWEQGKALPLSD